MYRELKRKIIAVIAVCCSVWLTVSYAAEPAVLPIQHWQTPQGLRVLFVRNTQLPMLDIQLVFSAGAARDGEHWGLAALTNTMLGTGAVAQGRVWDENAVAARFDEIGAVFATDVGRDSAMIRLRTLVQPDKLERALQTFTAVLTSPTFVPAVMRRKRDEALVGLKHAMQQPAWLAQRAFYHAAYGKHPYAHMPEGTASSMMTLTVSELKAFYQQYYSAHNAVLVLVGAQTQAQAQVLAEQIAGSLPASAKAAPLPAVPTNAHALKTHIRFPSKQTHIWLGLPAIKRGDPDYFPLLVGNRILGAGMTSLLFQEVREKSGLVYDVHSRFVPMQARGPFSIVLQTRQKKSGQAQRIVKEVLQTFIRKGPTQAQLTAAKQYLRGSFPLRLASNTAISHYLATIGRYELPLTYLDDFLARVDAVTQEDIRRAFARHVPLGQLATVTVGASNA